MAKKSENSYVSFSSEDLSHTFLLVYLNWACVKNLNFMIHLGFIRNGFVVSA